MALQGVPPILPPAPRGGGGGKGPSFKGLRGSSAPPPRGYGVLAPRPSGPPPARGITRIPTPKTAPRVFAQPLSAARAQNLRTGGYERQYAAQHPRPQGGVGVLGFLEHPERALSFIPRFMGMSPRNAEITAKSAAEVAPVGVPARGLPGLSRELGRGSRYLAATGTPLLASEAAGKTIEGTGVGGVAGRAGREFVNLPTQALVGTYLTGKNVISAGGGNTKPLQEEGQAFLHNSAIAHLFTTGDVHGALKIAGEHPVGTGLEAWGLFNGGDSLAGRLHAPKMTDDNVAGVSRAPKELVPGGATKPQQPYAQAPIRNKFQRKLGARQLSPQGLSRALREHFNRFQSDVLGLTRNVREKTITTAMHRIKEGRGRINDGAVQPHGDFLAKPGVVNPATGREFYHEQLEQRIRELGPTDRYETPQQKQAREDVRSHLIGLQDIPLKDRLKTYNAAMDVAKTKRASEPELAKAEVFTHEEMANAKRASAFQFIFGHENAHYDPLYEPGQSPFHLGGPEGPTISRAQVDEALRANGIDPNQLSFTSARPYQSPTAPFRTGFRNAIGGSTKGRLSGMNFLHGQKDPTYEAVIRQELTDQQILNHARAQAVFNKNYVYDKEYIAKQIEAGLDKMSPADRANAEKFIVEHLRNGQRHFPEGGRESAKQNAATANAFLKMAQPNHPDLVPVRVTHMFAKNRERGTVGRLEDLHDHLDPNKLTMEGEGKRTEAGPYGLVHHAVADQLDKYEKYLGQYHPGAQWASFWRRNAVAWSPRHPGGVSQELLLRLLTNQAGPISYLQHTRLLKAIRANVAKTDDPALKHQLNVYEARMGVGSHAANTMLNERFTTPRDWKQLIEKVRMEKPVDWWRKGESRTITGAPLRAVKTIFKGYNGFTRWIIAQERRYLEHPLVEPLAGKAQSQEFKRLTGKRLKFAGAIDNLEKEFMAGRLNPKAIDHTFNVYKDFAGDWQRSSPGTKKIMTFVPFWQWTANSLRFIYVTMPLHHPMKTAALVAMEHATEEARKAEGQGYPNVKSLFVGEKGFLQPSQQGSLPVGAGRLGAEYYSPFGAVSGGVEGALSFLGPYATSTWELMHGRNPVTGHDLKESEQNEIAQLLGINFLESVVPPARYGKQLIEGKPATHVFRPLRTEPTRSTKGVKPGVERGIEAPEKPEKAEKAEAPEKPEKPEKP